MKRSICTLFFCIITLALLSGCTSNTAAHYAEQMKPVLKDFNSWFTGDLDVYHQLLETPSSLDPKLTYGDLVMGTVYTYRIGKGTSPSQSWSPVDIQLFQGILNIMHDSAVKTLEEIKAIKPTSDIQTSHEQLKACLQYQVDVSGSLLDIFTKGTFSDLAYQSNPCENVETSYEAVNLYVQQNSPQ
jgi:hypothetical protein